MGNNIGIKMSPKLGLNQGLKVALALNKIEKFNSWFDHIYFLAFSK
jgi:hypothetical protein